MAITNTGGVLRITGDGTVQKFATPVGAKTIAISNTSAGAVDAVVTAGNVAGTVLFAAVVGIDVTLVIPLGEHKNFEDGLGVTASFVAGVDLLVFL